MHGERRDDVGGFAWPSAGDCNKIHLPLRPNAARRSLALTSDVPEPSAQELSQRARRILYAVITEFIATGEPVGSRTLERKYGLSLSAASIRNVLADLEDEGYLLQRHTSAGRIPTDRALRFFIDALMQLPPLTAEESHTITHRFEELAPGDRLLRESGRLLSEMTNTAAVVIAPRPETRTLRQLRFLPTRPGEMLAVLVLSDGSVENRFVHLTDGAFDDDELNRVHNLLADVIEGRTLGEVRDLCARRLADERVRVNQLRHRAFDLGHQAASGQTQPEVLVEGHARLLDHPELTDVEQVRELVLALQDRELLLSLLEKTELAEETRVLIGHEIGEVAGGNLSVVSAPYTDQGRVAGTIGVVGLVRMDYSKVVTVVSATAKAMSAAYDRARRDSQ